VRIREKERRIRGRADLSFLSISFILSGGRRAT